MGNHWYRYLDTLSFLDPNIYKQKKILDVGSFPGHFIVLLYKLGYNVYGIDIDPKRVRTYLKNIILK